MDLGLNGKTALVAYVCSTKSAATNGAALRVDGGLVRSIA